MCDPHHHCYSGQKLLISRIRNGVNSAKHQAELGESCGRIGVEVRELKGPKTPQVDLESTKLCPWGLTETEPPTKEHAATRSRSSAYL